MPPPEKSRGRFLEWARQAHVPLTSLTPACESRDFDALGRMIGDAPLVALSEAFHGAAEPLELRNQVFQYLVQERGFTAIAIESGIVESRVVYDYVRGDSSSDLSEALAQGISWTFDELPQNRSLVHWLREYNAHSHGRPVNFYGFDVPGSPGNAHARRGMQTALHEVLEYLSRVEGEEAATFRSRFEPFWDLIGFDPQSRSAKADYRSLSQAARDSVTAAITDLLYLIERREARYSAATSGVDFEWAHRAAIGAHQADAWLRQVPIDASALGGRAGFLSLATDVRDRAQAENLEWIVEREGPGGKILIFASRYHLSTAPVTTSWWSSPGGGPRLQQVAGTYLRRRFTERLVTIGNLVGAGSIGCAGFQHALAAPHPESIDALAAEVGAPLYLLDLRAAPAGVARWLDEEHLLGPEDAALRVSIRGAFDVLFYVESVTPACVPRGSG